MPAHILGAADVSEGTAIQLADWLEGGKPELGWKGDPRLELRIGVLTAAKDGTKKGRYYRKGEVMAHRFEVYRHTEEGKDTIILSRSAKDWHEIIPELVKMDPRTPGHESMIDLVDRANRAIEKTQDDMMHDVYGEAFDYTARLAADREWGPSTFRQVGGLRDEK